MDGLRLILLLLGVAVIAGVWWWSTRRADARSAQPMPNGRAEPTLGPVGRPAVAPDRTTPGAVAAKPGPAHAAGAVADAVPGEARIERGEPGPGFDPDRDMILSLFVLPAAGERFLGAEVVETLGGAGLRFGKRQVFHRHSPDGASMYCVANMVEPGTLEPEAVRFEHVPGLLFFAVLPGPRSGTDTFADMIATARRVAQRLRGELADAERSSLTPQTIQHLRERVVAFESRAASAEG